MPRPSADLRRRKATLAPKLQMHIYCEDQNAAPQYFAAMHSVSKLYEIVVHPAMGVTKTIVEKCVEAKSRFKKSKDEVWAVFDRDEHLDYHQSIDICDQANIGTACSNPCFELWILLHSERFDRPDDRHAVQRACSIKIPEYDGRKKSITEVGALLKRIETAESHATWLIEQRRAAGDSRDAPSTTVHILTARIRATSLENLPPSPER